jgi:ATP-dependent Zn protease
MSEEKKKSPFSIYWIYAALGVALIAFQIYIIIIWIFVMRRMAGGGGGGGSQIFNIGKSRAQVYDKGKSTNITFKMLLVYKVQKKKLLKLLSF